MTFELGYKQVEPNPPIGWNVRDVGQFRYLVECGCTTGTENGLSKIAVEGEILSEDRDAISDAV
jgi:hypothetical protein